AFPRAKPCGGGLTGHAAEAMAALGLELTVPALPSPRAEVRFGGFRRTVALPRPVRIVRREELDASLLEQARARGVAFADRESITSFAADADGVTVTTTRRTLRAHVLV